MIGDPPSPFVVAWVPRIAAAANPPRRALDLAMGRGRHARVLARAGFLTFGVDARPEAVEAAIACARAERLVVHGWCADLTTAQLPSSVFDLVLVVRYLQRDLFPSIRDAVRPGGFVLYETFTEKQRRLGTGPTSPDHLLESGELGERFADWELLWYEEVTWPEAVAGLVARKPRSLS